MALTQQCIDGLAAKICVALICVIPKKTSPRLLEAQGTAWTRIRAWADSLSRRLAKVSGAVQGSSDRFDAGEGPMDEITQYNRRFVGLLEEHAVNEAPLGPQSHC